MAPICVHSCLRCRLRSVQRSTESTERRQRQRLRHRSRASCRLLPAHGCHREAHWRHPCCSPSSSSLCNQSRGCLLASYCPSPPYWVSRPVWRCYTSDSGTALQVRLRVAGGSAASGLMCMRACVRACAIAHGRCTLGGRWRLPTGRRPPSTDRRGARWRARGRCCHGRCHGRCRRC